MKSLRWPISTQIAWRPIVRPLFDLVYPRCCSLCNKTIIESERESLCTQCDEELKATEFGCMRCSAPLHRFVANATPRKKKCSYCDRRQWFFRRAYCYTAYAGIASRAAKRMKQPNHEPLAMELGQRIAHWFVNTYPECVDRYDFVIPIPQHWVRRMTVRYNQAEVLAEQISKAVDASLQRRWLYRTRWTEKQGTKSIRQRLRSVVNSFACRKGARLTGAQILLVDDIVTSGATASDASRALRAAGAKHVDVVSFARGVGAVIQKPSESTCDEIDHSTTVASMHEL